MPIKHPETPLESTYRKLKREESPRGLDPGQVAAEFLTSVTQLEELLIGGGRFYDGARKQLPSAVDIWARARIDGTTEIASLLEAGVHFEVDNHFDLNFNYVDREIVAARALDLDGKPAYQASRVRLDLLLANAQDETPIVGEIKINDDKDPEAALLQGLVYASLLAPQKQRERLGETYPEAFRHGVPKQVDVYVIMHKRPESRHLFLESAQRLAPKILDAPGVGQYLRRICFLEAELKSNALRFSLAPEPPPVFAT